MALLIHLERGHFGGMTAVSNSTDCPDTIDFGPEGLGTGSSGGLDFSRWRIIPPLPLPPENAKAWWAAQYRRTGREKDGDKIYECFHVTVAERSNKPMGDPQ